MWPRFILFILFTYCIVPKPVPLPRLSVFSVWNQTTRFLCIALCVCVLLLLLFGDARPAAQDFYGIMLDAGSTGQSTSLCLAVACCVVFSVCFWVFCRCHRFQRRQPQSLRPSPISLALSHNATSISNNPSLPPGSRIHIYHYVSLDPLYRIDTSDINLVNFVIEYDYD